MRSTPLQTIAAIPQLVLYGLLGGPVIGALLAIFFGGIGTIPALIGIVVLAFFGFLLFGLARFEEARAGWTFDLAVPAHPLKTSRRTDGWAFLHTLVLQYADARTWVGILHGFIVSILGVISLIAVWGVTRGIAHIVTPRGSTLPDWLDWFGDSLPAWAMVLIGLVMLLISVGALIGLALAHRAISRMLLVPDQEVELRREAAQQSQARQQALSAADIERSRIERDLHDGLQPRLVSIGMTLGMARRRLETDPAEAGELIDEAHESVKTATTELRQLVRGFQPAVLQDRGLDAALSALIGRSSTPIDVRVDLPRRASDRAEATMYFAVAESLTNAAKHGGGAVRVDLTEHAGNLVARIVDSGPGGAHRVPGGGIDGVTNRVAAAGGSYRISSPEGGPTEIEVIVPCAS